MDLSLKVYLIGCGIKVYGVHVQYCFVCVLTLLVDVCNCSLSTCSHLLSLRHRKVQTILMSYNNNVMLYTVHRYRRLSHCFGFWPLNLHKFNNEVIDVLYWWIGNEGRSCGIPL